MRRVNPFTGDESTLRMQHAHRLRVRYGETDAMGYVYYGNYPLYLEVGRNECMRAQGYPYGRMENEGVMMPVAQMLINYHEPACYDDELVILTGIYGYSGATVNFGYTICRAADGVLNVTAQTTMAFVDATTRKAMRIPEHLMKKLENAFKN